MKTINLPNKELAPVFNFLEKLKLSNGKANRGKAKFLNRLQEKNKEYVDELEKLKEKYYKKDEEGEYIKEGNSLVLIDEEKEEEAEEKLNELLDEESEISFVEYSTKYEALFDELDNLNESLTTKQALAYDSLMDAYEANGKDE